MSRGTVEKLKEEKANATRAMTELLTSVAGVEAESLEPDHNEEDQNPKPKRERKTSRLNLTMTPTMKREFSMIAYMKRATVSGLISDLVNDFIEDNRELVDQYKDLFGDTIDV